jgi:hypothetical protein
MEKRSGELLKFVMNSKIKMRLGQLLGLCFQLRKMMTKSLLKMEEVHIADVCKIATAKMEDFDEAILKHI